MNSYKESIIYYIVRIFGIVVRLLPLNAALWVGRVMGLMAYYFDTKHKSLAYANLKMAFAHVKSPEEIKQITKELFKNYGQNFIELFRMPLMDESKFTKVVSFEGKENVTEALKEGKGCILLAMHFGSWEMASLSCSMFGHPYKVIVKPQTKYNKLDDLLNSYRECGGSVVLSRGMGTRDFIKSLKNNEIIGMVVDQGGRDGVLVPLFGREASMSVGAIRMGLKLEVPLCFSIIIRENKSRHRMIIQKPITLINTGNLEEDIVANLKKVTEIMEGYISQYPSEYMWFYKIWKYSKEANITVLSDGKTGHLRQSENVAQKVAQALGERDIKSAVQVVEVHYESKLSAKIFSLLVKLSHPFFCQGRLEFLKFFLTEETYKKIMAVKADFVVSCGSSIAGVNHLLSQDHNAKSIAIQKPGLLSFRRFDLVVLPKHDAKEGQSDGPGVVLTHAAPNLINDDYLKEKSRLLSERYSHLSHSTKFKIGLFIGGDAKDIYISGQQIRTLIHQLQGVLKEINAQVLITTSRRTPKRIEQILEKECKSFKECAVLILANKKNVPEAVGGILGLSDLVIVSGDSISMVSEAASSGKNTIVFPAMAKGKIIKGSNKHKEFVETLHKEGYIFLTQEKNIRSAILDMARNKIQTKQLNDQQIIFEAVRKVI